MITNKFQQDTKPENPCKIFAQYKGSTNVFKYYDKERSTNLEIPLPMYFVPLAQMWTIKGFDAQKNCGIYANEVRSLKHEQVQVRNKNGVIFQGFYDKHSLPAGAKLFMSLYGVRGYRENGKPRFELISLLLKGTQISAAIDSKFQYDGEGFEITPSEKKKSTFGVFTTPEFKSKGYNESIKKELQSFADELFEYREQYVKYYSEQHSPSTPEPIPEPMPEPMPEPDYYAWENIDKIPEPDDPLPF